MRINSQLCGRDKSPLQSAVATSSAAHRPIALKRSGGVEIHKSRGYRGDISGISGGSNGPFTSGHRGKSFIFLLPSVKTRFASLVDITPYIWCFWLYCILLPLSLSTVVARWSLWYATRVEHDACLTYERASNEHCAPWILV